MWLFRSLFILFISVVMLNGSINYHKPAIAITRMVDINLSKNIINQYPQYDRYIYTVTPKKSKKYYLLILVNLKNAQNILPDLKPNFEKAYIVSSPILQYIAQDNFNDKQFFPKDQNITIPQKAIATAKKEKVIKENNTTKIKQQSTIKENNISEVFLDDIPQGELSSKPPIKLVEVNYDENKSYLTMDEPVNIIYCTKFGWCKTEYDYDIKKIFLRKENGIYLANANKVYLYKKINDKEILDMLKEKYPNEKANLNSGYVKKIILDEMN